MSERIWYYLGRDEGGGKPSLLEDFESLGDAISWAASWAGVEESEIDYEQVLKTLDKHGCCLDQRNGGRR